MKKVLKGFLCAALALSLFGCKDNTNLSTKAAKDEDYSDIFTDKEKKSGFYKNSFIAYNFSLENMGTTKVYVDTSEGHKFELVADEGGFNILNKKGEVVVYARAINDNAYEDFTGRADLDEIINGRDFKCLMTDNGKMDAFTNLADVGIDIGFAMEAPSGNPSDFSLVAFRGEPVKSSKKKETKKEEKKTEKTTESKKGSLTDSTLSKDVQEKLDSLDTDYAKVNWGVQYSFGEDYSGLVVSVTPAYNGISHYLIVALTNLYDSPMRVTGTA
ncbi:MAG: hypothetical protein KBT48_04290 [Firmicutes bacterium]|nr:hypothetical protein [Bacillota bacterium]